MAAFDRVRSQDSRGVEPTRIQPTSKYSLSLSSPSLSLPSPPLSSSTLLAATNSPLNCGTSAPPLPLPPHSSSVSSLLKHQASPPLTSPYSDRRSVEFLKVCIVLDFGF
ncbi:hypothetical protein Dimus_036261 [Dionaea muscipula]